MVIMQVCTGEVVEVGFGNGSRLLFGEGAVESKLGKEVVLELDAHRLELFVVHHVHVDVALRVGEDGKVPLRHDLPKDAVEVHGRTDV